MAADMERLKGIVHKGEELEPAQVEALLTAFLRGLLDEHPLVMSANQDGAHVGNA